MTKFSFVVCAVVVFIFISCNGSDTKVASAASNSKAQKNMEVDDAISKAFETNNASMLDSLLSPDFIDHTGMGDRKGIDSVKSMLKMMYSQFKDMKMDRKRQWADDDYVVDWVRYTGTNSTPMMGMPAGPYDFKGIELSRFSNAKAVEHWFFWDDQTMAEMMKNMNGADKMKNDSTKTKSK